MGSIVDRMADRIRMARKARTEALLVSVEDMERLIGLAGSALIQEKKTATTLNLGNVQGLNQAKSLIIAWRGETHPPNERPSVNKHADRLLRDIEAQLSKHTRVDNS